MRTTGYNPRANGLTEKANQYIKNYLTAFTNFCSKEWDAWCREAAYAYNSSVQSSTGFTPARLMFGRDYRVPTDVIYGISKDIPKYASVMEYERMLSNLYSLARESMVTRQSKAATYYDSKVRDCELKEGDDVYVLLPRNLKKKLTLKWSGPHKIISVSHPAYEVEIKVENTIERKWVTRDKLKLDPPTCIFDDKKNPKDTPVPNDLLSSSDSESETELEGTGRQVGKYSLRRNPQPVNRYGNIVTHTLEVFYLMFQ